MSIFTRQGDEKINPYNYGYYVHAKAIGGTPGASLGNELTVFCAFCTQKTWVVKETSGNAMPIEIWGDLDPNRTQAQVETHNADLLVPQTLDSNTLNSSEIEYETTASYAWMTFRCSGASATFSVWFAGL